MRNNHELPASPSAEADALPDIEIDHPALEQWNSTADGRLNESQRSVLEARYKGGNIDVEGLIDAVSLACARSHAMRGLYESETIGVLKRAGAIDREDYEDTAGKTDRFADHLKWFNGAVNDYVERLNVLAAPRQTGEPDSRKDVHSSFLIPGEKLPRKLGVELGGNRQAGSWESAQNLHKLVRSVEGVSLKGSETQDLTLREQVEKDLTSFRYEPINGSGQSGLLRRRLQVGDFMDDGNRLMIYRETMAVLVLGHISLKSRKIIEEDIKNHPGSNSFAEGGKNNTKAAMEISKYSRSAGREAERLIRENVTSINALTAGSKALIRPIVPASVHYVVVRLIPSMVDLADSRS